MDEQLHHWEESDYLEMLRKVKEARENSAKVMGLLSTERTLWNTEHQELLKAVQEADQKQMEAERALHYLVAEDHAFSGRTKYAHGVQVRIFETLQYDPIAALDWAKSNMPVAVKTVLDVKTFEAYAKNQPIQGVTETVRKPKVFLPTKIELEALAPTPEAV